MYKNILVPVDINEDHLTELMRTQIESQVKTEATHFHFLTVLFSPPPGMMFNTHIPDFSLPNSARYVEKGLEILKNKTTGLTIPNDRAHYYARIGTAWDEILKLADEVNADLIIIGSNNPEANTHLPGSTADAVVLRAKTSVLVVR